MREIKFRAWIKRKNELMHLKGFRYSGNEKIKITFTDEDCDDCTYTFLNKDVILEQFTGLHDKNGVEIYEGDILHAEGYWDIFIEFEKGSFMCMAINKVQYVNKTINIQMCNFDLMMLYEVIGNIHESEDIK